MPERQQTPHHFLSQLVGATIFLAIGALGGIIIKDRFPSTAPPAVAFSGEGDVRENSAKFQFVNPLLECDLGQEAIGSLKPKPSRAHIETLIEKEKARGTVSHVSVYYRDLNNGPWMGIMEKELFAPASLLKVPIVMSFFKRVETDPALFYTIVTLGGERQTKSQYFKPTNAVQMGGSYPLHGLMEYALRYSDNDAVAALSSLDTWNGLRDLFQALHIDPIAIEEDRLTVKDYAGFFRVLFNASYLTSESSERILQMLSQADFNQGLTAKLPKDLRVAHKSGERASLASGTDKQLHDCGIVYVPKNPYLLCIMTRGDDMDRMADVIADISKAVYDEVMAQQ